MGVKSLVQTENFRNTEEKKEKKMLCNKGKNRLHLKRSCSCQNKEIYGMYVSGRIFRCISRINRVRCFQTTFEVPGEKAQGLPSKGLAREDKHRAGAEAEVTSVARTSLGTS